MSKLIVTVNGYKYEVEIEAPPDFDIQNANQSSHILTQSMAFKKKKIRVDLATKGTIDSSEEFLKSPFNGIVLNCNFSIGDKVNAGDVIFFMEAMKMKTSVSSPRSGIIAEIFVNNGDTIESGANLLKFE